MGVGSSPTLLITESFATPTTSKSSGRCVMVKRLPIGSWPGQSCRVTASLTIATSVPCGLSKSLKSRPFTRGMPRVSKKPGETSL